MKSIPLSLRFALLWVILFTIVTPIVASEEYVLIKGIGYCVFFDDYYDLKPDVIEAYCLGPCFWDDDDDMGIIYPDYDIAMANILSLVSSEHSWDYFYEGEWYTDAASFIAPVTMIEDEAFMNRTRLTKIRIPSSVREIGSSAFEGCCGLTSVTIPNSVTIIGGYSFSGCSGLTSVSIGNSVTEIDDEAFSGCSGLTSIEIPNSVNLIGEYAFDNCTNLKSVTIGKSVNFIGEYAFNCEGLRDIYSLIENPADVDLCEGVFEDVPKDLCKLHVPYGSEDLYRNADQWKDFFILCSTQMKTSFSKGFMNTFPIDEPMGVTADGSSRMYIFFDENINSIKSVSKTVSINDEVVNDPSIIGNFGSFKKLPNGKYGFDYCAPVDFPEEYSNYNELEVTIEVTVTNSDNKNLTGYKTFTVMRPGVLLIHGFGGDDGTFKAQYEHLLNEGGYYSFQVKNVNYPTSNTEAFDINTYCNDVVGANLLNLYNNLAEEGIISSKYDLVGHSMGGILSRLYAQYVNPNAVNRIITLDTPHYGSELADSRELVLNRLEQKSTTAVNPIVRAVCSSFLEEYSQHKYDAIVDLQTSSEAIKNLNRKTCAGIPVHAIGSYMTHPGTWSRVRHKFGSFWNYAIVIGSFIDSELLKFLTPNDLGYALLNELYGGQNDGIVSLKSQLGGLSQGANMLDAPFKGDFGIYSDAFHTNTHDWTMTVNYITNLLHQPKTSGYFCVTGFRPSADNLFASQSPKAANLPELKDAPETSFIQLNLEKNEENEEDRNLVVRATTSEDIENFFMVAFLDDGKFLISACDNEPEFAIPDSYEGQLVFYALGFTANDELVADIDSVEYSSIISLAALDFEEYDDINMSVGQTLGFNVIATWENGEEEYVRPVFTASPSGMLDIDGQLITPVTVGECYLIAEYRGLTCVKKIIVTPPDENPMLKGDVNLDGEVNIADINAVIDIILTEGALPAADVNGDGEVNIADINTIINIILS